MQEQATHQENILGPEEMQALQELERRAKERLPADSAPITTSNPFNSWTDSKSPYTDEEIAKIQRADRAGEAKRIRARLPAFFATVAPEALERAIAMNAPEHFKAVAEKWTPTGNGNLLLLGETRQFKSSVVASIFYRLLRAAWSNGGIEWEFARGFQWVRADDLEREMQAHPHGRGQCPAYNLAAGASLLFLDDLGWERDPSRLATLIADRYDHSRMIVATSGLTPEQLTKRYGEAVVRKLLTFRNRPVMIRESFPSSATAAPRGPRPPGDQEELAKRLGEKDD